jgi:hypothetical protein
MFRPLGTRACTAVLVALAGLALGCGGTAGAPLCDREVTPSSFATELSEATDGETICLSTGDYGTFTGTSKAVTIRSAEGADARMGFDLGSGDANFTLEGLTFNGRRGDRFSAITGDVRNVTFRDSRFTLPTYIDGPIESGILFDRNRFVGITEVAGQPIDGGLDLRYGDGCTATTTSGITVRNSLFANGNFTPVKTGCGLKVLNNVFRDICENLAIAPEGHTANIEMYGAPGMVVRGNYFTRTRGTECEAGAVAAYDGLEHALIEDNVIIGVNRPWGIELYSDDGSVVRHNTLEASGRACSWDQPCGQIHIASKLGGSPYRQGNDRGAGTQVYDNIAYSVNVEAGKASVARDDHNMLRVGPTASGNFLGIPRFAGRRRASAPGGAYRLAHGSPGRGAASDGRDVGSRF